MMALIRQRIDQGWSDQQIVDGFVDTYGGSVLLDPPFRPGTLLLWLVPAGALVAGILVAMRRRRRPPAPPEEPAVETRPQPREAAS
jgi:cytochrome c-type biogenesis protein CcmH